MFAGHDFVVGLICDVKETIKNQQTCKTLTDKERQLILDVLDCSLWSVESIDKDYEMVSKSFQKFIECFTEDMVTHGCSSKTLAAYSEVRRILAIQNKILKGKDGISQGI